MSVLDKFLDAIRLNDDYDDEDEFFDDDIEDEYEDEKPKRRFFKKLNDGDLDENEEEYIKSVKKKTASVQSQPKNCLLYTSIQSFINIAVATGLIPNTGTPLPFVSYGLTSLWSLYIGMGLALNVGLQNKKYFGGNLENEHRIYRT